MRNSLTAAALAAAVFSVSLSCGGAKTEEVVESAAPSPSATRAPAPAAYKVTPVANAGSVTGTITLEGPVPALKDREVTQDKKECGGDHVPNPSLVVGPGNTVANAVVRLEGVASGKAFEDASPELDQKKCLFQPYVQVVRAGSAVTILNSDPVLHNVHAYDSTNETMFNIGMPLQGIKQQQRVQRTGLVRIKCDVHPWMSGYIYAAETPYAAVTGADGLFTLTAVPPGTYTLTVWHELLGTKSQEVTVPPPGAAQANVALRAGA